MGCLLRCLGQAAARRSYEKRDHACEKIDGGEEVEGDGIAAAHIEEERRYDRTEGIGAIAEGVGHAQNAAERIAAKKQRPEGINDRMSAALYGAVQGSKCKNDDHSCAVKDVEIDDAKQ